jgi:hypothetical protein
MQKSYKTYSFFVHRKPPNVLEKILFFQLLFIHKKIKLNNLPHYVLVCNYNQYRMHYQKTAFMENSINTNAIKH